MLMLVVSCLYEGKPRSGGGQGPSTKRTPDAQIHAFKQVLVLIRAQRDVTLSHVWHELMTTRISAPERPCVSL